LNNNYRPVGFGGGFLSFPPVIKNLLIINGIVFFLQVILDNTIEGRIFLNKWLALNPINITGYSDWPYNFQVWQLITYQFMHGGFSHILFNMFALWMFGSSIENVFGSKKFLIFYLLAGISAGLLHLFVSPLLGSLPAITIGASGSVYGVLIAYALFFPDNLIFLYFLIPVKAKYLIGFLVVIEFLAVDSASSGVAHLAHLGGALFAFLYIMFDKNSYVELKNVFKRSYFYKSTNKSKKNMFDNLAGTFRRNTNVDEANYYDINRKEEGEVTQAEIDEILDKISQSGYQNLTEREKKILFQASKKMK
jgi:membrane associated rhomboid family serine protease